MANQGIKKPNSLTQTEYLELAMWCQKNESLLTARKFDTWTDVAICIGGELGRPYSIGSVKKALKDVRISLETKRAASNPVSTAHKRIEKLESIVVQLLESLGETELLKRLSE